MNLDRWHDLFLACAGAGSALAGLIIVAISANIATILKIPSMTSRAAATVAGLILIVVLACAGLIPGQPAQVLGIEAALASTFTLVLAARSAGHILRCRPTGASPGLATGKAALGVAPPAGSLIGGLLLCAGPELGLYIIAAAIITGFATSVTNAWVLLVEILR